jgi:hypothetical protein
MNRLRRLFLRCHGTHGSTNLTRFKASCRCIFSNLIDFLQILILQNEALRKLAWKYMGMDKFRSVHQPVHERLAASLIV